MRRREFLAATGGAAALTLLPGISGAAVFDPRPGGWRRFEVVTRVDLARPGPGPAQIWLPLPSIAAEGWMKPEADDWQGDVGQAAVVTDPGTGTRMLHVTFPDDIAAPSVSLTSRFMTRDRGDTLAATGAPLLSAADRAHYLAGTTFLPVDGIVKETADRITAGLSGDEAKARAIYDWVVENTRRVAEVRGCGLGDVASLLKSGNLGGKCADINALMVALSRAADVPARDLYGIRVAPSAFGYKSLGANSETITKAQHCRAEVWLEGRGWVPVDPADVRKVILEEPPGNNSVDAEKVTAARAALFGAWEGNWLAFNDGHDIRLPGSAQEVAFLMYPQAEVGGVLLDCLDAQTFAYAITSRELPA